MDSVDLATFWNLPAQVAPRDIRAVLKLTARQLRDLAGKDGSGFPAPADHPGVREPRWRRDDLLRWAVDHGYAPVGALPTFDPPHQREVQRWKFERTELISVDAGTATYALMRYRPYLDAGEGCGLERILTICIGVDYSGELDGAPSLLRGGRLSSKRVAELGYSARRAGGIVLLDVRPGGTSVLTVDVPPNVAAYDSLPAESTVAELVAEIIGHSLPLWPTGYATSAALARWDPLVGQAVAVGVPPRAECAYVVRRQIHAVVTDVRAGRYRVQARERSSLIEGLRAAGNTLWDVAVREDVQPVWPWVRPYVPPVLSSEARNPRPVAVASRQNLFDALAWLFAEPNAPRALCRVLAAAYGTQETIAPVVVDLTAVSVHSQATNLRAALEVDLVAACLPDTWMRAAVAEKLVATAPGAASSTEWVWSTSPDPQRFPVLRSGSLIGFHVPRQMPDGFVPDILHILRGSDDSIVILALDSRNRVAVVPALTQDPVSAACCLTAIALGLPSVDEVANIEGVCGAPEDLVQLLSSVMEVAHTFVEWSAVQQLVGERPWGMSDIQLHRFVSQDSEWPLGQP